jgi:integrase
LSYCTTNSISILAIKKSFNPSRFSSESFMKTRISKRTIDAVAPRQKDVFLWDTDLAGFGCKITPADSKVYVCQYRTGGRIRRYTIGLHGPLTPELARREATRILGDVARGADPAEVKAAGRKGATVSELADRYLAQHAEAKKKPKSIAEDRRLLDRIILPALGPRKVVDVTRGEIDRLHYDYRDTPYQANRVLALLSKVFNLAESWGMRAEWSNPCRHVEKFKEKKRKRFLSVEELTTLGAALKAAEENGTESPQAIAAIRLLVLTGARMSEILTLRWDYVNFDRGALELPDSKTGEKSIPLSAPVLEVLSGLPVIEGNPYVIPGHKRGAHLVGLQKIWERLSAGLADVRIHDLRHSFASVGAGAGLGLPVIGALLGHLDAATTQRYAHLQQDPLRQAADIIASKIDAALKSQPQKMRVVK